MAFLATYPPLAQVTVLNDPNIAIHAVLEVPPETATEPWQLSLWYCNGDGGDWALIEFMADSPNAIPTDLSGTNETATRLYFTAKLEVASSLTFTVKFRRGGKHEWRWVRTEQGSDDGIVVVEQKRQGVESEDLPDLIQDLNPDLRWQSHMSQSPGTRLWSIEATVDGANEDESAVVDIPLGIPWGRFFRWFALVRTWTPWLAPRQGKSEFNLDKDALLCSFLSPQGKHMVLLGMSGVDDVMALLRSGDSGRLMLHIRSDNAGSATATALVAVGDNFESTVATVMYHARTLVTSMAAGTSAALSVAEMTAEGDVSPQWYESWYDGLGYCTWNSLGQELTEQKVLKALDTLAENKVNISTLIIDDNWQDIDYRGNSQWQHGWNDFEAEPKTFPRGLKALISDIRSKHKHIQHIAVWHALLGYWAGLAPDGPLAKRYKTIRVARDEIDKCQLPIDGQMTLVAREDVQAFYNDFYNFLSSCDIDGVKTDGQYMLDTWTSPPIRRTLIPAYLDAWTLASLRHFSARVVSCMSQSPPILFRSQLPHTSPPIVCRNSDDFFPPVPDSHPWHLWTNAHNAHLTQHLNVLPDWDMFQTVHPYAGFHAAARCVSGGPVYITDVPGRHDVHLIRQVTGITPRGKTVVFRPSVLGKAMDVYAGYRQGQGLLKIGAFHGRAAQGTGIVGVFNIEERGVVDFVPLGRFPGVMEGRRYVVRAHGTGRVSVPLEVGETKALLALSLEVRGYEVLCAYPLHAIESRTGGLVLVANLGLIGKMTGCAAVLNTVFEVRENGRMLVDATLKALGVLGVYISALPQLSVRDDFMVTIQGQPIPPHTVALNNDDEHVLNIDIETAWNEMGLESGWANEVEVKVYFDLGR
ncbi:glycoside hydrolase family 36 protein [Parathielavia appendiculata]|uniref:Glycoside hydrolase family 36 protein n=1 Tax=Parathielavia appendiculata TaxID=2587402 RepID=A0AAN6UCS1_9PEZI|nr:glycoside hydrolase family 36 protein [Parathielavia appendiculata]